METQRACTVLRTLTHTHKEEGTHGRVTQYYQYQQSRCGAQACVCGEDEPQIYVGALHIRHLTQHAMIALHGLYVLRNHPDLMSHVVSVHVTCTDTYTQTG